MALPTDRGDREYQKFEENSEGDVAVRVILDPATAIGSGGSSAANTSYLSTNYTVTSTHTVAKVGGSNLANRKTLTISNRHSSILYYGPPGSTTATAERLQNNQLVALAVGPAITVEIFRAVGSSGQAIVQEFS